MQFLFRKGRMVSVNLRSRSAALGAAAWARAMVRVPSTNNRVVTRGLRCMNLQGCIHYICQGVSGEVRGYRKACFLETFENEETNPICRKVVERNGVACWIVGRTRHTGRRIARGVVGIRGVATQVVEWSGDGV